MMTASEEESQQKAIAEQVKRELTENVFPDDATFAETFFGLLENHVQHTQRSVFESKLNKPKQLKRTWKRRHTQLKRRPPQIKRFCEKNHKLTQPCRNNSNHRSW